MKKDKKKENHRDEHAHGKNSTHHSTSDSKHPNHSPNHKTILHVDKTANPHARAEHHANHKTTSHHTHAANHAHNHHAEHHAISHPAHMVHPETHPIHHENNPPHHPAHKTEEHHAKHPSHKAPASHVHKHPKHKKHEKQEAHVKKHRVKHRKLSFMDKLMVSRDVGEVSQMLLGAKDEQITEYLQFVKIDDSFIDEIRKTIDASKFTGKAELVGFKLKEAGIEQKLKEIPAEIEAKILGEDPMKRKLRELGKLLATKEIEELKKEIEFLKNGRVPSSEEPARKIRKIELRDVDNGKVFLSIYDEKMSVMLEKMVAVTELGEELAKILKSSVNGMEVGEFVEILGDNLDKKMELIASRHLVVSPRGKLRAGKIMKDNRIVGIKLEMTPSEAHSLIGKIIKEVEQEEKEQAPVQTQPPPQQTAPKISLTAAKALPQIQTKLIEQQKTSTPIQPAQNPPPVQSAPQTTPAPAPSVSSASVDVELMKKYLNGEGLSIPKKAIEKKEQKPAEAQPQAQPATQAPAEQKTEKKEEGELSISQLQDLLKGV